MPVEHARVIFRIYPEGDVIALFIDDAEPTRPWLMSCYQHMGQHGNADYDVVRDRTRLATAAEYAALRRELAQIGYVLTPMQRWQRRR